MSIPMLTDQRPLLGGIFQKTSGLSERALTYHVRRHALISANIANAQTPGYRPKEITFRHVLDGAARLEQTSPAHYGGDAANGSVSAGTGNKIVEDSVIAAGLDGNRVSMERQMAKLSANSIRFRALAEMVSRRLGMLKYAATEGRS